MLLVQQMLSFSVLLVSNSVRTVMLSKKLDARTRRAPSIPHLKLLDGVGTLAKLDGVGALTKLDGVGTIAKLDTTYLVMESSGFSNDKVVSHSSNDTLKNMKNGHDNLKYLFSQYRSASFETIKKGNICSCQIIENKVTLRRYAVKSRSTWKVVECRSASIPLDIEDSLEYIRIFELFAFMLSDIEKQKSVFRQLKLENLGLVPVPEHETVARCLF